MNCMVSGSHGLIGSNMVKLLEKNGHKVRAYIRFGVNSFEGIDWVFHMAGLNNKGDIPFYEYYSANIRLTEEMLYQSHKAKVKKFLFPATSADKWKNTYAFSKRIAEDMVKAYNVFYGLNVVSLNLPKVNESNVWEIAEMFLREAEK